MPPKAAATPVDAQRNKDALYIFDNLFQVINPVVFNIAEIAENTGTKANTLQKRFSIIRQRYAGLNIQTTVTGGGSNAALGSGSGSAAASVPPTPKRAAKPGPKPQKAQGKVVKPAGDHAKKEAEDVVDDDDDDNEANGNEGDTDEDEGEEVSNPKAKPLNKSITTPAADSDLADDENTTKKPAAKPTATKAKAKAKTPAKANANANTAAKRKRSTIDADDESPTPAPKPKKTKVAPGKQVKKTKKSEVKVESDDHESDADELGKQASHNQTSPHTDTAASVDANANTAAATIVQDNADLALDVVQHYADRSHRGAINMSSSAPLSTPAPTMARSGVRPETPAEANGEENGEAQENQGKQPQAGVSAQINDAPDNTTAPVIEVNAPTMKVEFEHANPPNRPDEGTATTTDDDDGVQA